MVTPLPTKEITKDICEKCAADRDLIRWMLKEPRGSDNWEIARRMLYGCIECQEALKRVCKRCGGQILPVFFDYTCLQCGAEHDERGKLLTPPWLK